MTLVAAPLQCPLQRTIWGCGMWFDADSYSSTQRQCTGTNLTESLRISDQAEGCDCTPLGSHQVVQHCGHKFRDRIADYVEDGMASAYSLPDFRRSQCQAKAA